MGTMDLDTIYGRPPLTEPVGEWGGIAYALAALDATLPDGWQMTPLVKVGRDLAAPAREFLRARTRRAPDAAFLQVPEPNNRVLLHYSSSQRRTERLTGGVPPWDWDELRPRLSGLDALYLNFISGFELDLTTARRLREAFDGPIYADLHSLLLGITRHGDRFPQPLVPALGWFSCFDAIQLNEEEMTLVGEDPMATAARAFAAGVDLLLVTLGERGAVYFTTRPFRFGAPRPLAHGPIETARIPAPVPEDVADTTGCGDVFGAAMVSGLLDGRPLAEAIDTANRFAARNVSHRGATYLTSHLRGEIAPR